MDLERLEAARAALVSDAAPVLLAVGTALPPNVVDQQSLAALLRGLWSEEYGASRRWQTTFDQVHRTVRIDRRYLALPVSEYAALDSFGKTNAAWTRVAPELGAAAVLDVLGGTGLGVRDVDHLFLITGTGIATPSIDARLVNRLGMRPDVLRTPWPAPPTTCAPIQELAHAGRKAGFGMLPALAKPAIEDFNYGVGADAGDRGHVEHTPDLSAPAPYTAALAQAAAAVAINSASSGGPALPASIASQEQRCDQKIGKSSGSAHWREAHSKGLSWSGRNLLAAIAT